VSDRTETIRSSIKSVQNELLLAVALVVMVTFLFLRKHPGDDHFRVSPFRCRSLAPSP